jgi:photosystem II stability/assembly factor-like uncharacterized protein
MIPMLRCTRFVPILLLLPLAAQQAPASPAGPDPALYEPLLEWRLVGPFRGGRSCAVSGVPGDRDTYWHGSTGGGVWLSRDAGRTWRNVSDGFFGGSIGAIAVAPSDRNVVYAGTGEKTVRGNVSHGDGIWRSTDEGRTWQHAGLPDSRHVCRIRVHPQDPDVVWAAALGHLFGPNDERGVFKSADGGKTWKRTLFAGRDAGAVDLALDPTNPRILYATTWRVRRTPYSLESGGDGSGLWKSTDSGETWTELSRNEGLPKPPLGISGIAVAPREPDRLYAIVEAPDGGVFTSRDAGATWRRVNSDRNLRQRAWYYTRICCDPIDPEVVYVLNVGFHRSQDGGRSFSAIPTPHGDNHDLWIDPADPRRMIEANDGGVNVSFDGGRSWTAQDNQPTAQFYRVTTDRSFPYRIYGAQQDNSTVRIASRGSGGIGERDWEPTAGGESGHIAVDPRDPDIVYGGSYGGYLQRIHHRTGERRAIHVWPDNPIGHGAGDVRHRFQWNFPLFFSPHDPARLYAAGNRLFVTQNEGQSWEPISPDLTRADPKTLGPSGGPITKDNTGVEYYATIFAAAESPVQPGVLWCGSDDGLLHLSRDGGKSWSDVTPTGMPAHAMVNSIEPDPRSAGGLYVAATCYKSDDLTPYLYATADFGRSWRRIDAGIPRDRFTRVVRADPRRPGLLYCGTERGVYVSFDDGAAWRPLQLNLPIVPVTDLTIADDDLIAATQGRAFWVLDDLTPLRHAPELRAGARVQVLAPKPTLRLAGGGRGGRGRAGERGARDDGPPLTRGANPPGGVPLRFWLGDEPGEEPITLEVRDRDGRPIRRFSTKPDTERDEGRLEAKRGANVHRFDLRHADAHSVPGMILWAGGTGGPLLAPGRYTAVLAAFGEEHPIPFEVRRDPRSSSTDEDLVAQETFLLELRDKLSETHRGIERIRSVRSDLAEARKSVAEDGDGSPVAEAAQQLERALTGVEEALYQTKNQSSQDPLNFPIRLNNRLSALAGTVASGDYRPTDQALAVGRELIAAIDEQLSRLQELLANDLAKVNEALRGRPVIR